MNDNIKICYRAEFPKTGKVLTVEGGFDEAATITVSMHDNDKLLRLKKFTDYNEAINYYSELFDNLKIAEEYETMVCALKKLGLWKVNSCGR